MENRDPAQVRKAEPVFEPAPIIIPDPATSPLPPADDLTTAGEMPAWLKESEVRSSFGERHGGKLFWGVALVAIAAVAGGGLWLQQEHKASQELAALARSSQSADLGGPPPVARLDDVPALQALPPEGGKNDATILIDRKPTTLPPLVTLPPEQTGIKPTPPAEVVPAAVAGAAPATVATVVAGAAVTAAAADIKPAPAPKAGPVKPVVKPVVKPAVKPVLAKAAPKPPKAAQRAVVATRWPPPPSRKLVLAQNVVPKKVGKGAPVARKGTTLAKPKSVAAVKAKPVLAAKAKPKPRREAGIMLPPPRAKAPIQEKVATLPASRAAYQREAVPVPRPCGKGELARDCAN